MQPATNRPPPFIVPRPKPPVTFTETWVAFDRWSRANGLGKPKKKFTQPPEIFALTTPRGTLELTAASQVARWDGMLLQLGFAPRATNGVLFVHNLDLQKNLQPLLENFPLPPRGSRVIVIDPGHGGVNSGTRSVVDGRPEKEFTLDWARRLAPLLVTNGWTVFLTRTNDTELELSNRVAFTEARRADIFVSLHFNSGAPNENPAGLETYCLTPTGMPSNLLRTSEDDTSLKFNNNWHDAQNLQLAVRLHRALLAGKDRIDRGVRHARFIGVLRGQNRPAVLIEGGYLSNPDEAKQIANPAFRQKLAEAVADALK